MTTFRDNPPARGDKALWGGGAGTATGGPSDGRKPRPMSLLCLGDTSPNLRSVAPGNRVRTGAFSLPELIIGASLSTIVLAGVMSAFVMLGRSGVNATNYSTAESEIRRGIEAFSQDVRMASALTLNSATSITLTLPAVNPYTGLNSTDSNDPSNNRVTYEYNATSREFVRWRGVPNPPAPYTRFQPPLVLVRNIATFNYAFYNGAVPTGSTSETEAPALSTSAANFATQVKRVQISLNVRVAQAGTTAITTPLAMASTIMRNKLAN